MEMGRTCMVEAGRSLVKSAHRLGAAWWGTAARAPGYTVGRRLVAFARSKGQKWKTWASDRDIWAGLEDEFVIFD